MNEPNENSMDGPNQHTSLPLSLSGALPLAKKKLFKERQLDVLSKDQIAVLQPSLADPIEPRKSGLSINHVIGCPIDCAYCIRHKLGNYEMKEPHMLMSDKEVVQRLLHHPFFVKDITPLQIFNKATDGFLPAVKPSLFNTLDLLDREGVTNDVLLITRYKITGEDCDFLNSLKNLRTTLLVTYSGIENKDIEPISNAIPIHSLRTAYDKADRYRVVLYWRPIVLGLNDSDQQVDFALKDLSASAHATVFTGLFYKNEIRQFFLDNNLPDLASDAARRKIFPEQLEDRIISRSIGSAADGKLFRKTSCAVSYVHGRPDYNGHYGIINSAAREICDICPKAQINICASNHRTPSESEIRRVASLIGHEKLQFKIDPGKAVIVEHMDTESVRYFLQHYFQFQFHDENYPHKPKQHGRADIGWKNEGQKP